jgi:hypothetical protein
VSIYVSSDVVLEDTSGDFRPNGPLVGYRQFITVTNITADEEAAGFPVTNLANPSTAERWKGTTTDEQSVTVFLSTPQDCDYIGIARHNLGTAGTTCQVQTSEDGIVWDDLGDDFLPGDDSPIMVRFPVTTAQYFRLLMTPGSAAPDIAVLYLGKLLVLQRNLYVGHTPMSYSYDNVATAGISESGQFLGAITRRANPSTNVKQSNLTAAWFRTYMAPFFKQCSGLGTDGHRTPFFFAWRPTSYPVEVAFGWFPEGAAPTAGNQRANGMMEASFPIQGVI